MLVLYLLYDTVIQLENEISINDCRDPDVTRTQPVKKCSTVLSQPFNGSCEYYPLAHNRFVLLKLVTSNFP